jgi:DNA polymerase/3'-5' exonuclease PolX
MKYSIGKQLADQIVELLKPYCEKIEIAGGIRRNKPEPHDIEIVCQPKTPPYFQATMLKLKEEGYFSIGNPSKNGAKAPFGTKYYRVKYKGEPLDIFVVSPPANFYVIYLIRTGDADFSHSYMNELLFHGMKCIDGRIWNNVGMLAEVNSELDCFKLIDKPFIEPEKRIGDIRTISQE